MALANCLLMGGAAFCSRQLFDLRIGSLGVYRLYCRCMPGGISQDGCCRCPVHAVKPLPTPASTGGLQHWHAVLAQSPVGSLLHPLSPGIHTIFFVPPKNGVSLPQIPWGLLVSFLDPRLECLMWGSEPLQQWDCFVDTVVPQSVGCPLGKYGISFYCACAPPTVLIAASPFGCGLFFGWVPESSF